MDNKAKLNLMKKRVIRSFKWQEDIIIPFSREFGCTTEELEDIHGFVGYVFFRSITWNIGNC